MRRIPFLLFALFLAACGDSAANRLDEAQKELAAGKYADAAAAAQAGLSAAPDDRTAWRLELVRLEALARSGDVDGVTTALERLAREHPDRVAAQLYVSTADQLRAAGKGEGAVAVLHMGDQRFPDDPNIDRAIEQVSSSASSGELEMLRTLGYIGD